jgi:hypothetical protein
MEQWCVKEVPFAQLEAELNAFSAQGFQIFQIFRFTWQNNSIFQIVARHP